MFAPVSNGPSWIYPVLLYWRLSANLSSTCYPPCYYLISHLDMKVCLLIEEVRIPAEIPLTCCTSHHPLVHFSLTDTLIRLARGHDGCRIGSWPVCHRPIRNLRQRQESRSLWLNGLIRCNHSAFLSFTLQTASQMKWSSCIKGVQLTAPNPPGMTGAHFPGLLN